MFELIGILVVVGGVWAIGKSAIKGSLKGTLLRACDFAEELGVPHDFAIEISKNSEVVTRARKELVTNNKEFAVLDAYEQYGHAIAELYEEECRLSGMSNEVMDKVKSFLQPQIDQLKKEGSRIHINDITYVYLGSLATSFSKTGTSIQQIRDLVKYVFPEPELSFLVDNGYTVACNSNDFLDKMRDILPVVNGEIKNGEGEFFIKYTRKANRELDKMFDPDFSAEDYDPRKVSRTSFLDV